MVKRISAWLDLHYLEDLARQQTSVHRLHPTVKLLTTLAFAVTVTSFEKYEIEGLLPLFFYPIVLMALGSLPYQRLLKRLLFVSPVVLCLALFNPLFDRTPHAVAGLFVLSGGWLSFVSITLKLTLTTMAALILVATTAMPAIGAGLRRLGVPGPLVVQLLLMYRYLYVLLDEVGRVTQAYELRSAPGRGLPYRAWGSLLGQLLLRAVARAQQIYQAMLCRGFNGSMPVLPARPPQAADYWHLSAWLGFFLLCRLVNLPQFLGNLVMEVL